MKDLLEIPCDKYLKLVSFDITNMYSNIPTKDLIQIIDLICNQNDIKEQLKKEIKIIPISNQTKLIPISRHTTHTRRVPRYGRTNII